MTNRAQLHSNQGNCQAKEGVEPQQYQKLIIKNNGYELVPYLLKQLSEDAYSYSFEQMVITLEPGF